MMGNVGSAAKNKERKADGKAAASIPASPSRFADKHGYIIQEIVWPNSASATAETIKGAGADSVWTSLTDLNGWPSTLCNESLFPFLLPEPTLHAIHPCYASFGQFVKAWHQCSCAIVYCPAGKEPMIIGSGNLVDNGLVSTARHVFDEISSEHLKLRFFRYDVRPAGYTSMAIREDYIDLPIREKWIAKAGLDAGYLEFDPIDSVFFSQYAKILPRVASHDKTYVPAYSETPPGQYALFHFAGGTPLVSIGNIESTPLGTSPIMSIIAVEGGPGASGGAAITLHYSRVEGHAILACRPGTFGATQRVFIDYGDFIRDSAYGPLKAPYAVRDPLGLFNSTRLNEDGREFLRYNQAQHGNRRFGGKFGHPDDPRYTVLKYHSNHHIIPIDDLVYLYEYFHHLDRFTYDRLMTQAQQESAEWADMKRQKSIVTPGFAKDMRDITNEQEQKKIDRFKALTDQEIVNRYGCFHVLLIALTPSQKDDKSLFAWAFWNLFQGWDLSHRADDPAKDGTLDFSEKQKPQRFNSQLWRLLKDEKLGLFACIQQLKASSASGRRAAASSTSEMAIRTSLTNLSLFWRKEVKAGRETLYAYDSVDWEPYKKKNQIKPGFS